MNIHKLKRKELEDLYRTDPERYWREAKEAADEVDRILTLVKVTKED